MRSAPGRCGRVVWLLAAGLSLGALFGLFAPAHAQERQKTREKAVAQERPSAQASDPAKDPGTQGNPGKKIRSYTFGGLDIDGRLKTPQLLYFLNRMKSEFDTTVPDKRSFLPELKRSPEEM